MRRWVGEVIITFYQMPVLVEARGFGSASTHLFEDSRRCVSCGVRELVCLWNGGEKSKGLCAVLGALTSEFCGVC